MQLQIKTHKPGRTYAAPHLFILSKGHNAGKPLDEPCPNCFVAFDLSSNHRERLYWLCYALWQAKAFDPYINGSVIPFIHIRHIRHLVNENWIFVPNRHYEIDQLVDKLSSLLQLQKRLRQQLKLSNELKIVVAREALRLMRSAM